MPSSIHMAKSLQKEAQHKTKLRRGGTTKLRHASAQSGSPSLGGMAKKPAMAQKPPAIGGKEKAPLTDKYFQRSQHWNLHFKAAKCIGGKGKALACIQKLNKDHQFLLAGSTPFVDGLVIRLTWRAAVTGKTVYGFFRTHAPTSLGPEGCVKPTNFVPGLGQGNPLLENPCSTGPSFPYPPLPSEFARASFANTMPLHVEAMKEAIEEFGFIILPSFIPDRISTMAFGEATAYFLGVMRSFKYGQGDAFDSKGMEGFDDLAKLPSAAWEKRPRDQVTLTFEAGTLGMTLDFCMEVRTVVPDSQASLGGVKPGWKVARVGANITDKKVRKSLTADVIGGWLSCGAEITFQPPTHYSPLAVSQKWGVFVQKGYQPGLGLGKSTDPINFNNCHGVMNAQLSMRNLLASLHGCLPTQLCWQPDGVSFKAGHTCSFPLISHIVM